MYVDLLHADEKINLFVGDDWKLICLEGWREEEKKLLLQEIVINLII